MGAALKKLFDAGGHAMPASIGLLVMRLVTGLLLLSLHGFDKLVNYREKVAEFPSLLGLGPQRGLLLVIIAEVVCASLVMLGLATRVVAVPVAFAMAVAAFVVHADGTWAEKELALLYLAPFFMLVCTGAGRISLDAVISK